MSKLINLNGKMIPSDQANVSVFDRSFLFGDSLYEVVRTYQGKPFRLKEHLERLESSARLCQMILSQPLEEYEEQILKSIEHHYQGDDLYVRLVVSRGTGAIGFSLKNLQTPTTYVIYVEPISKFPNPDFERGLHLHISKRIRNHPKALDPAMKSGNYLNNLLAYLSAVGSPEKERAEDALMVDQQNFLTEGTTFNVFYVNRGIVATPPLDVGILDGITRQIVLSLCVENKIPCREVRFPREYLFEADEVFASSSLKEVMPITQLDGKKIGSGKPGPITRQLKKLFEERVKQELELS